MNKRAIEGVSRVLLVASGKGGVGKSTVAANLATSLAAKGVRTGLLDADVYGPSVPRLMGLTGQRAESIEQKQILPIPAHSVSCMSMGFLVDEAAPIVWRGLMVMKAIEQLLFQVKWSPLDVLVVDMPPGTGDTQLSMAQLTPVHGAIVVTTPQELALADARRATAMFKKVNIPVLGCVENMSEFVCPCCRQATSLFPRGEGLADLEVLARLPVNPSLALASDAGKPTSDPAFTKLAEMVLEKLSLKV